MENIIGLMEGDIQGSGKLITCMGKEYTLGQMVESMKAIITRTKRMGTESTSGWMAVNTRASG